MGKTIGGKREPKPVEGGAEQGNEKGVGGDNTGGNATPLTIETLGLATLSTAFTTEDIVPDMEFFKGIGSKLVEWAGRGIELIQNLMSKIGNLFEELKKKGVKNFLKEGWNKLISTLGNKKTNPIYSFGTMLVSSTGPLAWIIGGASAVALAIGNKLTGGLFGNWVQKGLNFAEAAYNFDWNQSDEDLIKSMEGNIDSLYGPAGEFVGRSLAQMIVGGASSKPAVQINVRGLALVWQLHPEIREEMLQGVSQFAHTAIYAANQIFLKMLLMKGRVFIKDMWNSGLKDTVSKISPGFANKIDGIMKVWGQKGGKPVIASQMVEEKVEAIDDKNLQNFAEEALEGFWDSFRESIEYVYV